MPLSAQIAKAMFGAAIIAPPGLSPGDAAYVLIQSEYDLGHQCGVGDTSRPATQKPDLVVSNGCSDHYPTEPPTPTVGENMRVWLLHAGPNLASSFHVVGGQFDTVYAEGEYLLKDGGSTGTGGSQTLSLALSLALSQAPAQDGFAVLTFHGVGSYSLFSHPMSDAEKGAHGPCAVSE
ncbi:MAG: hypothetical protein LH475_01430 [Cryobacterium sp.]|uniref:hypothetical protein n=1 Tax=unclassified Cryobacterium TaxID=2649013 RepID=UPI0018CA45A1|nr:MULTISPECIES: hypothetical protein [unclassified Cryobacterium]MCY7403290.1 hypothetical protein [Cryobacterium sp.]MEC5155511.1 hypothetical protein [Cryobacterium sp. CAN_C3]